MLESVEGLIDAMSKVKLHVLVVKRVTGRYDTKLGDMTNHALDLQSWVQDNSAQFQPLDTLRIGLHPQHPVQLAAVDSQPAAASHGAVSLIAGEAA